MNTLKLWGCNTAIFVLDGKWFHVTLLFGTCAVLTGCSLLTGTAPGPVEETVMTVGAGLAAGIDYLLANEMLPPELAEGMTKGFTEMTEHTEKLEGLVEAVQSSSITTTEGGIAATGFAGLMRLWRGAASKGPLKGAVDFLKGAAVKASTPTG